MQESTQYEIALRLIMVEGQNALKHNASDPTALYANLRRFTRLASAAIQGSEVR